MTVRRSIVICAVMLAAAPLIYLDGSVPFASISDLDNPARAVASIVPFVLSVIGSVVNWLERR